MAEKGKDYTAADLTTIAADLGAYAQEIGNAADLIRKEELGAIHLKYGLGGSSPMARAMTTLIAFTSELRIVVGALKIKKMRG